MLPEDYVRLIVRHDISRLLSTIGISVDNFIFLLGEASLPSPLRPLAKAVSANKFLAMCIPEEKDHHLSPDQTVVISKILTVLRMPHSEDKREAIRILIPEFLKTIPHQHAHMALSSGSMYRPEIPAPFGMYSISPYPIPGSISDFILSETAFDRLGLKEAEVRQSLAAESGQHPRVVSDLEVWEELSKAKKKYNAADDPYGYEVEGEDEDKDEHEDEEKKASKSTKSQQVTFGGQPYTAIWGLEFRVEDLK
jgi:hypothetical protein